MGNAARSASEAIEDSSMTSVPKTLFFEGMNLPITIYFRLSPGNYLTIGRKGEKARFSDFRSFNDPNFLIFVKSIEHNRLIDYVTELSSKLVNQTAIPFPVKTKFLTSLIDDSIGGFESKGFASTQQLQKVAKMVMDLNQSTAAPFDDVMRLLSELPAGESKHAVTTAMISLVLAEEMQLTHGAAREKLALGALLHDVGMRFVPQAIQEKARHLWTPEELATYEMHPIKGVEMLRDMKDISNDVLLIVAEHHETSQGNGYPKKLRDVKISPLGRIVALADYFSELIFSIKPDGKSHSSDEAIQYIEEILGQPFNRQAFQALKNAVNKKHLSDQLK